MTDGRTDIPSYGDARTHLKRRLFSQIFLINCLIHQQRSTNDTRWNNVTSGERGEGGEEEASVKKPKRGGITVFTHNVKRKRESQKPGPPPMAYYIRCAQVVPIEWKIAF